MWWKNKRLHWFVVWRKQKPNGKKHFVMSCASAKVSKSDQETVQSLVVLSAFLPMDFFSCHCSFLYDVWMSEPWIIIKGFLLDWQKKQVSQGMLALKEPFTAVSPLFPALFSGSFEMNTKTKWNCWFYLICDSFPEPSRLSFVSVVFVFIVSFNNSNPVSPMRLPVDYSFASKIDLFMSPFVCHLFFYNNTDRIQ